MNGIPHDPQPSLPQSGEDGLLEKLARIIDPSGREISDDELIDPGTYVHDTDDEDIPPPGKPQDSR